MKCPRSVVKKCDSRISIGIVIVVSIKELPKVYLASPEEIAQRLKESAGGRGETILYENHTWGPRAQACNTTDKIPDEWRLSEERIEEMFKLYGR